MKTLAGMWLNLGFTTRSKQYGSVTDYEETNQSRKA